MYTDIKKQIDQNISCKTVMVLAQLELLNQIIFKK